MLYDRLLNIPPYSLNDDEKSPIFKEAIRECFEHHYKACLPYKRFCQSSGWASLPEDFDYFDLPYLPTNIFKQMKLSSVDDSSIVRTLQSSGTSSQTPSTVVIDNITRTRQVKTLTLLLKNFLGNDRRPFMVVDVDPSLTPPGQATITARTAALRGFLTSASKLTYFMDMDKKGDLSIDMDKLIENLTILEANGEHTVIFGYTYVIYAYVAKKLIERGSKFSLSNCSVLHIGGWKKLQDEAVSKTEFNSTLEQVFGIPQSQIIDSFGFTEQLGLVYFDCEDGLKRCPVTSEIVIRDSRTLEPLPDGEAGMVEFITPLPHSYPGMALLLDDIGRIVSRDQCRCGRQGTAFEIIGRANEEEIRGCGDVLAASLEGFQ